METVEDSAAVTLNRRWSLGGDKLAQSDGFGTLTHLEVVRRTLIYIPNDNMNSRSLSQLGNIKRDCLFRTVLYMWRLIQVSFLNILIHSYSTIAYHCCLCVNQSLHYLCRNDAMSNSPLNHLRLTSDHWQVPGARSSQFSELA